MKTPVAVCLFALVLTSAVTARAQVEDQAEPLAWAEVTWDVGSRYVWRGMRISRGAVSQMAVDAGFKGLGVGIWSNYDPHEYPVESGNRRRFTETDLTVSYGRRWGSGTLTGGFIHYALRDASDTSEAFLSYALELPLNPSATVYVDLHEGDGAFVLVSAGHSLPLPRALALDLGAEAGLNLNDKVMGTDEEGRGFAGPYHAEIWAESRVPLRGAFAITPRFAVSFPLTGRAGDALAASSYDGATRTCVYGSIGITAGF